MIGTKSVSRFVYSRVVTRCECYSSQMFSVSSHALSIGSSLVDHPASKIETRQWRHSPFILSSTFCNQWLSKCVRRLLPWSSLFLLNEGPEKRSTISLREGSGVAQRKNRSGSSLILIATRPE